MSRESVSEVSREKLMRAVDALVRRECTLTSHVAKGATVIDQLLYLEAVDSESEATQVCQRMLEANALRAVEKDGGMHTPYFRSGMKFSRDVFYEIYARGRKRALNEWFLSYPGVARDAKTFTEEFNSAVAPVMAAVLYNGGYNVHYFKMRSVPQWYTVLKLLAELTEVKNLGALSDQAKRAFFFNLANVMIFHSRTMMDAPSGLRSRGSYFQNITYNVNGQVFNYIDIEHGILRRKFQETKKACSECHALMVDVVDPRMHFALNCGAQSCPIIRPYTSTNLQSELDVATGEYLSRYTVIKPKKCQIKLPRLLKWFKTDFLSAIDDQGEHGVELVEFALPYLNGDLQKLAKDCINTGAPLHVKFRKYDWGDNASPDSKPMMSLMYVYDFSFFLSR
eukprot:Plantae.Rhodophyta-Purpureofilum_apyrenoidigerum.ctg7997.p1 GENE.Plantae.Rhodophyta-Purpureofilum_apyrenoidigerum.ctg7997~~Plantae.Rhodophyta-Purpureofilum_apyrenoidigerum.ctg7997.p1  ORF type:complete len:395 (-),score=63.77 Plantae.Rhodophyta-Purpureofilum_apyrenoidigerum.ctg7997:184-1368(-)